MPQTLQNPSEHRGQGSRYKITLLIWLNKASSVYRKLATPYEDAALLLNIVKLSGDPKTFLRCSSVLLRAIHDIFRILTLKGHLLYRS